MTELTRSQFDGVASPDRARTVYVAHGKQVLDGHGGVLAHAASPLGAERLAACANACNGIPTRELEAGILQDLFEACGRQAPERIRAILNRLQRL
jgi:hypothetical protein